MPRRKREQISWSNGNTYSSLSLGTGGDRGDTAANPQSPPLWTTGSTLGAAAVAAAEVSASHPSFMTVDSNASTAGATSACCGDNQSTYTYSSQRSSSLALDASSMSAACSATRPQKRQRTTLTDALQSIQLDRQIPEQIVPRNPSCYMQSATSNITTERPTNRYNDTKTPSLMGGSSFLYSNNLPTDPGLKSTGGSGDDLAGPRSNTLRVVDGYNHDDVGDCLIVDDNSQLTASDVEDGVEVEEISEVPTLGNNQNVVVSTEEMEDESSPLNDFDHGVAVMTDLEKAQRQVLLDLVLGKRNAAGAVPSALSLSNTTTDGMGQNPVNKKIEELFRQSWENVQKGVHPLLLTTGINDDRDDEDDELDSSGRLTTQDDMAVDLKGYDHPASSTAVMTDSNDASFINQSSGMFPLPRPEQPQYEWGNSPTDGMDFEGNNMYPPTWINNREVAVPPVPLPLPVKIERSDSRNMSTSMSISDID
jgi:hypothetical protein